MMEKNPVVEEEHQEEEELHWSQKPDADPEAVKEVEELSSRLKKMMATQKRMPRRQAIRMIGVSFFIVFLCYILYMSIGNPYSSYSFIFCTIGVTICLDDLSLSRKLGKIRKGEEMKINE